jgi:hypothetical protein
MPQTKRASMPPVVRRAPASLWAGMTLAVPGATEFVTLAQRAVIGIGRGCRPFAVPITERPAEAVGDLSIGAADCRTILIRRSSGHVPAEMPCSAAHEVFVDDLLFTVADVVIDKGPPLRLVRLPGAWKVWAVFVDRALGSCACVAESVLDFA